MSAIGTKPIRRKKMMNEQKVAYSAFLAMAEMRLHSQFNGQFVMYNLYMSCACS